MSRRNVLWTLVLALGFTATPALAQVGTPHYQFTGAGSSTGSGFQWSDPDNWVIVDSFDGSVFDPNPATYPDDIHVQFPDTLGASVDIDIDVAGIDGKTLRLYFLNQSAVATTAYTFNSSNGNTFTHETGQTVFLADDADVTFNVDLVIGGLISQSGNPQGFNRYYVNDLPGTLNNAAGTGIPSCVGTCTGLNANMVFNGEFDVTNGQNTEIFFNWAGTARFNQDNPDVNNRNFQLTNSASSLYPATVIATTPLALGGNENFRPTNSNNWLLFSDDLVLLGDDGTRQFQLLFAGELKAQIIESGSDDRTLTFGGLGGNISGNPQNALKMQPNEAGSTGDLTIRIESVDFWRVPIVPQPGTTIEIEPADGDITWGNNNESIFGGGNITGDATVIINGDVTMLLGLGMAFDMFDDDTPFDMNGTPDLIDIFNDYTGGTFVQSGSLTHTGNDVVPTVNQLPAGGDLAMSPGTKYDVAGSTQTLGTLIATGAEVSLGVPEDPEIEDDVDLPGSLTVTGSTSIGTLRGIGELSLGGATLTIEDALVPGHSAGTLTLDADLFLESGVESTFEIGNIEDAYDQVIFSGTGDLTLDGDLTILTLPDSSPGGLYTLFDLNGGSVSGSFDNINLAAGLEGSVVSIMGGDVVLNVSVALVPGDTDGDGDVDLDDYNELSGNMYTNVAGGFDDGDFDLDGDVDFEDFVIQALNFGDWPAAEETVSSIPEPASLVLLVLGGLSVMRRTRRA